MKALCISSTILCIVLLSSNQVVAQSFSKKEIGLQKQILMNSNKSINYQKIGLDESSSSLCMGLNSIQTPLGLSSQNSLICLDNNKNTNHNNRTSPDLPTAYMRANYSPDKNNTTSFFNNEKHNENRRMIYSGLWTYASLNYLYCDLAAFMDNEMHEQYHTGEVDGTQMTPDFIAMSAVFMQIALANVFLPQIINNDKTLRWVQIASGAVMTLVQSATLFVGEPTSYYAVFSGFEIATTAFITIDAIKWKF